MTKEELIKLPHLSTVKITDNYLYIETEDGYYATDFDKENGNIAEYSDFTTMYAPINKEKYPEYYIITEEEHIENENKKDLINIQQ